MACNHAHSFGVVFDDRFPILEHAQCSDCQHTYKTYGAEWVPPATRRDVHDWWRNVLTRRALDEALQAT